MKRTLQVLAVLGSVLLAALVAVAAPSGTAPAAATAAPVPFVSLPSTTIVDTATGVGGTTFAANETRPVTVSGVGGVPTSGIEAVALVLTSTGAATAGSLFADSAGATSSYPRIVVPGGGVVRSTTTNIRPSTTGTVDLRVDAAMDVSVVVQGYFPTGGGYHVLADPAKVLSTTEGIGGGRLGSSTTRKVSVAGIGGVPSEGVAAVHLRVKPVNPQAAGDFRVNASGLDPVSNGFALAIRMGGAASTVTDYVAGLGTDGGLNVHTSQPTDALILVDGWFDEAGGYTPVEPQSSLIQTAVTPAVSRTISTTGFTGVPSSGLATVALSLKVLTASGSGQLWVRAGASAPRLALSFGAATNPAQSATVLTPVGPYGFVTLEVTGDAAASATVIADTIGWTAPSAVPAETVLPTVSFASPAPSATVDATTTGTFSIALAAADAASGIASAGIAVGGKTYPAHRQTANGDYQWVAEVPALAAGNQAYQATVTDRRGNTKTATATYDILLPEPEATLVTPEYLSVESTSLVLTGKNSTSLTFQGDVRALVPLGKVLAAGPGAPSGPAPDGYLRKVRGVSLVGGNTVVNTRQAMLTEAVRQLSMDEVIEPESDEPEPEGDGPAQRGLGGDGEVGAAYTHTFQLNAHLDEPSPTLTGTLTTNGSLGVHVKIEISFDLNPPLFSTVDTFEAVGTASAGLNVELVGDAGIDKTFEGQPYDIPLGAIPTPVPAIVINPQIQLQLRGSIGLHGRVEAQASTGKRFKFGVRYDHGDWEKVYENTNLGGPFNWLPTISVDFTAKIGVAIGLELLIDDAVGLSLEATAALEVYGGIDTGTGVDCRADLTLNVVALFKGEVPVIGISLAEIPFATADLETAHVKTWRCFAGKPYEDDIAGTGGAYHDEKTLVSVAPNGTPGNGQSTGATASRGGNLIAFSSAATNLLASPLPSAGFRAYARRMSTGTTELLSKSSNGVPANDQSFVIDVTPDGKSVLFSSGATNLDPDASGPVTGYRLYIRHRDTGTTELVGPRDGEACAYSASAGTGGRQISDDGRKVVFDGYGSGCSAGDTNGQTDVFIRDLDTDTNQRISVSSGGGQLADQSIQGQLSGDGTQATFWAIAPEIDPSVGDRYGHPSSTAGRSYLRDLTAGTTEVLAVDSPTAPSGRVAMAGYSMNADATVFVGRNPTSAGYRTPLVRLERTGSGWTSTGYDDPTGSLVTSFATLVDESGDIFGWGSTPYQGHSYLRTATVDPVHCATDSTASLIDNGKYLIISDGQWPGAEYGQQVYRSRCWPLEEPEE